MEFPVILLGFAILIFLFWLVNSVYVIKEWERGVVLRLGRMLPEAKGAGLQLVFFPIDKLTRISLRIETLDVPAAGRNHARQRLGESERGLLFSRGGR
jgi:regulator of protease activity HflC (stomatin/prohibitin superfamily)